MRFKELLFKLFLKRFQETFWEFLSLLIFDDNWKFLVSSSSQSAQFIQSWTANFQFEDTYFYHHYWINLHSFCMLITLCFETRLFLNVQGPPYLLARYKTAILSKCSDDFQKNISWKQGSGSRECSCLMVFQIYLPYLSL